MLGRCRNDGIYPQRVSAGSGVPDSRKDGPQNGICRKTIENFYTICKEFSLSSAVLALSYALSLPGATSLVLGSETPEQVTQNVKLLEQIVTLIPEQIALLQKTFRETEDRILNPGLWFNAYK